MKLKIYRKKLKLLKIKFLIYKTMNRMKLINKKIKLKI